MPRSYAAVLPIARLTLRVLIVLNWLSGAGILALLVLSLAEPQWTFTALGVAPSPDTRPLMSGMRAIAVLGLVGIPLTHAVLARLLAMVETVRRSDPFVPVNARRLEVIAWVLLGLQLLGAAIGSIAGMVSTPKHPLHLETSFSSAGWLAVVLAFVLARVFAEGARMRDDLEGMV